MIKTMFIGLLLATAASSCHDVPPEASFLWGSANVDRDSAFATLTPSQQHRVFKYGITEVHPSVELRTQMASQGVKVLPYILADLKDSSDPRYLTALLGVLSSMRCDHGVMLDDVARRTISDAVSRAVRPPFASYARHHVRRIEQNECDG